MNTTAIILAGGRGSRMNFQDKAWMMHLGKPLIQHVVDRLTPQVDHIVISRNVSDPRYEALGIACYRDEGLIDQKTELLGPLAGIAACARHINTPYTLVVPCDTPELPPDLVGKLHNALDGCRLAIANDGDKDQPLILLAETGMFSGIGDYLESGQRSVRGWLKTLKHGVAVFDGSPNVFENINQPNQLKSLLKGQL